MRILGLSAFGGESAAALLVDGVPVAAAAEERFTRRRRDAAFPRCAIRACLREAGLGADELDHVAWHGKPLRAFERVLASQLRAFPGSARTFAHSMFTWLGDRLWLKNRIATELGIPDERVLFVEHHRAHAASAFLASPFDEAAVLVVDGAGEWAATSLHHGRGTELAPVGEVHFPHSLGLFTAAMAEHLGLSADGDDEVLADLAAHGRPVHAEAVRGLLAVRGDGSYALDMAPFRFAHDAERLCAPALAGRLGPPRPAGAPLRAAPPDTRDADLAASVQLVLGEALVALATELHRRAPSPNLCLAGDVFAGAANVARVARDGPFERLYVAPAPGDAGGALGAALVAHHALAGAEAAAAAGPDGASRGGRRARPGHAFLGEAVLEEPQAGARRLAGEAQVVEALLDGLARGGMVGWVRGRFEWGPRALGHRSLLADPRDAGAPARVNAAVARRESFRPFACVVAAEAAPELLELPAGADEPLRHGQLRVPARDALRARAPAVVHADGSACPQLVTREDDPALHALLVAFGRAAGVPVLLHAPLCLRGDPPVRGEQDACALLQRSALPLLVVEDRLYTGA